MNRRLINSQIRNFQTCQMYLRQCLTLAENVFKFEGLPSYMDEAFIKGTLLRKGAIAFFKDEVLDELLALPFNSISKTDVYKRPTQITVTGDNGYTRVLNKGEFVIMYDNDGRYPLYLDIVQYSERLALCQKTIDINIGQQKTPRIWKTKSEYKKSLDDLLNTIDAGDNQIMTYDSLDLDDTTCILQPAPYIADKVDMNKEKIWNEFLRLIGVANLTSQKKERNIKDEIMASQGGTIASRFSRFEPRKRACEQIKELLGYDIKVSYYDGLPTNLKQDESEEIGNESISIAMDDSPNNSN